MTKYYGLIGYSRQTETRPGVVEDVITERPYYGDILRTQRRDETAESIHNNILIKNEFSIVADAYAREHFFEMKYISWQNTRWLINEIEVEYPRLRIKIGGIYNGPLPS